MTAVRPLKLFALDQEDLAVLSAHAQDAVAKVGDIRWSAATGSFAIPMNRFAWENTVDRGQRGEDQRRRAVLSFSRVVTARVNGLASGERETVLSLLALVFDETDAPAGSLTIICAGGVSIRLEVECIEAQLADLGATWAASMRPKHVGGGR